MTRKYGEGGQEGYKVKMKKRSVCSCPIALMKVECQLGHMMSLVEACLD